MDAPATYGWILLQDRKNRERLGGLPSFDELFAARATPDIADALRASSARITASQIDIRQIDTTQPKAG